MTRGEKGGVVLDGPAAEEEMPSGEEGDAALASIEEADKVIDEQGGTTDTERGTEDNQVGEDDSVKEGEVPENSEEPKPKSDDRLSSVEKTLQEIHSKLNEKQPEPPKQYTEEEWAKLEQSWGVPRAAIENMTQQNVRVVSHLTNYIDSKFAKLEFGEALNDFAKTPGFQDAVRYKKDIQEFLNTYEPKHWSNPELLKRATIYSRGLNANGNIQKARNDSERNRKIAGPARPASPAGGSKKLGLPPLTQTQKEAAALMEGGEQEYQRFRANGGRKILE